MVIAMPPSLRKVAYCWRGNAADGQRFAIAGYANVCEFTVGGAGAGRDRRHAPVRRVQTVRAVNEIRRRFGRASDAASLAIRCGGVESSHSARTSAAVMESCPHPAQSVDMAPS